MEKTHSSVLLSVGILFSSFSLPEKEAQPKADEPLAQKRPFGIVPRGSLSSIEKNVKRKTILLTKNREFFVL
jgi:hypothetical protein